MGELGQHCKKYTGFLPIPHQAVVWIHYTDVMMGAIASQITSLTIAYSTVYSDADHRKHQSSASLAFVRGIYRGPVNSPHKWPVTRKMFPFDDVIMWPWLVVNYTLEMKQYRTTLTKNANFFNLESHFESDNCKICAILWQDPWVKTYIFVYTNISFISIHILNIARQVTTMTIGTSI